MKLIGHKKTKEQLSISTLSAKRLNTAPPHILFSGAPGCGKTSMARLLAEESNYHFLSAQPNDMKGYDEVMRLFKLFDYKNYDERGDRIGIIRPTILFFDEIHNMPLKGQEVLGIAMENYTVEAKKSGMAIWVPYFTVVGATTKAGKLSKPFLDRFKLRFTFEPYSISEMVKIVRLHALKHKVFMSPAGLNEVAKRSRGTPRIAVGFVERIRDKMLAISSKFATVTLILSVFNDLGIDEEGFTTTELKILKALFEAEMPVGLDNLSIITEEDRKTISDSAEPFLIRKGFILKSGKGRIITPKGIDYIQQQGHGKLKKVEISFDYKRK
jgi:Holliday junction DNA helicase RuvB